MHKAFDLAQSTAYMFAGSYPVFSEVEEIAFKKPVDIGSSIARYTHWTFRLLFPVDYPSQATWSA